MKICCGCKKEKPNLEFLNASIDKKNVCHICFNKSKTETIAKEFDYPQNLWDERCKANPMTFGNNE